MAGGEGEFQSECVGGACGDSAHSGRQMAPTGWAQLHWGRQMALTGRKLGGMQGDWIPKIGGHS